MIGGSPSYSEGNAVIRFWTFLVSSVAGSHLDFLFIFSFLFNSRLFTSSIEKVLHWAKKPTKILMDFHVLKVTESKKVIFGMPSVCVCVCVCLWTL